MVYGLSDIATTPKVFIGVTVIEAVDVLALTLERILDQPEFNTTAKVALLMCLATVFMLYFAINGVLSENRFELLSYLFVTFLISFCTIYAYTMLGRTNDAPQNVVIWIRLGSVFCPLNLILGWLTYKSFGWKLYRKIGASATLQRMYMQYQIFVSLLKVDLLFATGLVLGIGLFQLDNDASFYIDLAMLPIVIGWAMLGLFGVRHEGKISTGSFLAFAVLEPIYIAWKVFGWVQASPSKLGVYTFVTICTAAGFAIVVRVCLVIFAKGLKNIFERKSTRLPAADSEEADPFLAK